MLANLESPVSAFTGTRIKAQVRGWRANLQTFSVLFKSRVVTLLVMAAIGGAFLGASGWPGIGSLVLVIIAVCLGYGAAAAVAFWFGGSDAIGGLPALLRLIWTSVLLGAVFLSLGQMISGLSRRPSAAAGLAIGLWLVAVVLYDLGLLAAIVADDGGVFTTRVFPWLLVANPADALRIYNLAASDAVGAASGLAGAAQSIALWKPLVSLFVWMVLAAGLARLTFGRVKP